MLRTQRLKQHLFYAFKACLKRLRKSPLAGKSGKNTSLAVAEPAADSFWEGRDFSRAIKSLTICARFSA